MLVPALIVAATGLLITLVSLPLWRGKIRPNWFYGFRTPRTLSNEQLWNVANTTLGRDLAIAGLAQVAIAMAVLLLALPEIALALSAIVPMLIAMGHSLWVTSEAAYRLSAGEPVPTARQIAGLEGRDEAKVRRETGTSRAA